MNLLPLVQRELRVASRRPLAYRIRMGVGGGAMGLTVWSVLVWSGWASGARLGYLILVGLSTSAFVATALAGLFLSADCVSRERRDGTLGLLFLTDLQSADVVLGKLAAKSIVPLYALMAAFPSLAVCIFFGGVTGAEFWRLFLLLGNSLFFSLSVCLLVSCLCHEHRSVHATAFLVTLFAFAGLPGIGFTLSNPWKSPGWGFFANVLSPTGSYLSAFDMDYKASPALFWGSFACTHLMSWSCLGFACLLLSKFWRATEPERSKASAPASRFDAKPLRQGGDAERQLRAEAPVAWLARRNRPSPILLWISPCLVLLLCLLVPNSLRTGASLLSFGLLALIHTLFKIWLAAHTSYAFARGRQTGALELLLGTPVAVHDISSGMQRALRREFGPPLVAMLGIDLLLAAYLASKGNLGGAAWCAAGALMSLFDCYCICWIALWRGLASRSPALAIISTVATTMILPWLWFAVAWILFQRSSYAEFAVIWLTLAAFNNGIFLIKSKEGFREYFRTLALRPHGSKPPLLQSDWSPINWENAGLQEDEPILR